MPASCARKLAPTRTHKKNSGVPSIRPAGCAPNNRVQTFSGVWYGRLVLGGQDHTPPPFGPPSVPYHTPEKVGTQADSTQKEFAAAAIGCEVANCTPSAPSRPEHPAVG